MAKARGRPRKAEGEGKGDYLDVRLEPSEKEAFKRAAELSGLSVSSWVRERLRQAARKELVGAGEPVPFLKRTANAEEP